MLKLCAAFLPIVAQMLTGQVRSTFHEISLNTDLKVSVLHSGLQCRLTIATPKEEINTEMHVSQCSLSLPLKSLILFSHRSRGDHHCWSIEGVSFGAQLKQQKDLGVVIGWPWYPTKVFITLTYAITLLLKSCSEASVKRRRDKLGLYGSRKTSKLMTRQEADQLVVDQLDKDPAQRQGLRTTWHKIATSTGVHLPRDFVDNSMHCHNQGAFDNRNPRNKKIIRIQKVPVGIHERWAGDGHDKLYCIGFPIWAVVDDATAKWLGAWVVPSNRMGVVVAYLYLILIEKFGGQSFLLPHWWSIDPVISGMALQFSTDCGSETTLVYALGNALRYVVIASILNFPHLSTVVKYSIQISTLILCLPMCIYAACTTFRLSVHGYDFGVRLATML